MLGTEVLWFSCNSLVSMQTLTQHIEVSSEAAKKHKLSNTVMQLTK